MTIIPRRNLEQARSSPYANPIRRWRSEAGARSSCRVRKELIEAKAIFLSEEEILRRAAMQRTRFLAHPIYHLRMYIYRKRGIEPAIVIVDKDDPTREIKEQLGLPGSGPSSYPITARISMKGGG